MKEKKYVAYVGTYTHGNSKGIYIYDLDVENGRAIERKVVPINNPSYIKKSHNGKYLYSISDEGVTVFSDSSRWRSGTDEQCIYLSACEDVICRRTSRTSICLWVAGMMEK